MIINSITVVQIITISIKRKVITIIRNCVPSPNFYTIYCTASLTATTNPTALIINNCIALIIAHAFTNNSLYLVN